MLLHKTQGDFIEFPKCFMFFYFQSALYTIEYFVTIIYHFIIPKKHKAYNKSMIAWPSNKEIKIYTSL